jgi:hypothetical protein
MRMRIGRGATAKNARTTSSAKGKVLMETTQERERTSSADAPGSQRDFSTIASETKSAARETAGHLAEQTRDFAEEQKMAGADNMARLGSAVHGAAEQLARELPQAAGFVHSAADTLQSASSTLRERSIEEMVTSFRNFAQRQPAAAFAGSVLAGFALARFLKSSSPRERG